MEKDGQNVWTEPYGKQSASGVKFLCNSRSMSLFMISAGWTAFSEFQTSQTSRANIQGSILDICSGM